MISIKQARVAVFYSLFILCLYSLTQLSAFAQRKVRTTKQFNYLHKLIDHGETLQIDFTNLGENDKINIRPAAGPPEISILHLVPSACRTCALIYEPGEKINDNALSTTYTTIQFRRPNNVRGDEAVCIDIAIRPNTRVAVSINGNSRLALSAAISQPKSFHTTSFWGKGASSRNKFFAIAMTRFTPETYDNEKARKKP